MSMSNAQHVLSATCYINKGKGKRITSVLLFFFSSTFKFYKEKAYPGPRDASLEIKKKPDLLRRMTTPLSSSEVQDSVAAELVECLKALQVRSSRILRNALQSLPPSMDATDEQSTAWQAAVRELDVALQTSIPLLHELEHIYRPEHSPRSDSLDGGLSLTQPSSFRQPPATTVPQADFVEVVGGGVTTHRMQLLDDSMSVVAVNSETPSPPSHDHDGMTERSLEATVSPTVLRSKQQLQQQDARHQSVSIASPSLQRAPMEPPVFMTPTSVAPASASSSVVLDPRRRLASRAIPSASDVLQSSTGVFQQRDGELALLLS